MALKASVVDLFAGPGGLGEGFSSFRAGRMQPFQIKVSVEKEASAHKTLLLRAFFRQFSGRVPSEYYQYLKGQLTRAELFEAFPNQFATAHEETLGGPRALGDPKDDDQIYRRLRQIKKASAPWVVIGGPPCQAYSLVGRSRNKGIQGYRAEEDKRHFLYEEYLRVLNQMAPEVFVMENVKGILSAKVNGRSVFSDILQDLSAPAKALGKRKAKGYKIYSLVHQPERDLLGGAGNDYIIRAEEYGVPQARHRVILLGVREDLEVTPGTLLSSGVQRSVNNVLSDLPMLRSGLSKSADSPAAWHEAIELAVRMVSRIKGVTGLEDILDRASRLTSRGERFQRRKKKFKGDEELAEWYLDEALDGFVNHESRGHMADDLARYLFCAYFAKQNGGSSPRAKDFPDALAPKHANWNSGKFVDRFKVQAATKPSSTVTSHISKDGHYFIHPDPSQCRSLTVREAARLQTFPDNYLFEGNRTQQYVQVGNAVPPLLARQIAAVVYKVLTET